MCVLMTQYFPRRGLSAIAEIWYSRHMSRERAAERLQTLGRSGTDLVTLWRDAGPLLAEAIPHFEAPCFFTTDPTSLLLTSHFQEGLPEIPAEWLGREYVEPDYNTSLDVLRSATGVGTLYDATAGQPELSRKYHEEMQPFGCEQELLFALRTRDGQSWGIVGLYRENGRPAFDERDLALVRSIAPTLAEGARHGLLRGQALEPDLLDAPGLLVLDPSLAIETVSPTAAAWLDELGGSIETPPVSVLSLAGKVIATEGAPTVSRVLSSRSRWLVVHGARLSDGRVSVILDAAQPSHLEPLLMQAYGLTAREQEITRLVLRGQSTAEISGELFITDGTVQAHLKSVFDKTGVRSRRELVGMVFQRHYEPRVRDNERRTTSSRPSRDGPFPGVPLHG